MSTLKVNDIVEATSGGAKIWPSRAWVSLNGYGTIAIQSDGGVSSITDVATGRYTVTFDNAFGSSKGYSSTSGSGFSSAAYAAGYRQNSCPYNVKTASQCDIQVATSGGSTGYDAGNVSMTCTGNT
jgi:hypothetical protein